MGGRLVLEVRRGDAWLAVDELPPGRSGSVSDNQPGADRDVLIFECQDFRSVIHRSAGGVDWESGNGAMRVVMPTAGMDLVAELTDGQAHEQDLISDRGISYRIRWTHRA